MNKVAVIYWSGTGNTEMMANAIADGAKNAGAEVQIRMVGKATVEMVSNADALAFGCPSMGAEVLEECEMEPFIASLSAEDVSGKPTLLFGSYDWGNGMWMDEWVGRMKELGATVIGDGLINRLEPDEALLSICCTEGARLVCSHE